MKSSKTISFENSTWATIEAFMEREGLTEASDATEQLVLAGAEAKKVKTK